MTPVKADVAKFTKLIQMRDQDLPSFVAYRELCARENLINVVDGTILFRTLDYRR